MKKLIYISILVGIVSCNGATETSNNGVSSNEESTKAESAEPNIKSNPDLLVGDVIVNAGDKNFKITEFDKRRSEITYMDDNKISVRLTSIDKNITITAILSGPEAYGAKPSSVTMKSTEFEKSNHLSLAFQGLLGDKDRMSNVMFLHGNADVAALGEENLDFRIDFNGTAIHTVMMPTTRDTLNVSGSIDVTIDNAQDVRQQ